MPQKFDRAKLREGWVVHCRAFNPFAKAIRGVIGSYGNHDGMLIREDGKWYVGEAINPRSTLTPLENYEESDTIVRIWRCKNMTDTQHKLAAEHFYAYKLDIKYPRSVARLWIMRFVNGLPWAIPGQWCTRMVDDSLRSIVRTATDRPDGKHKKNVTPRTYENRLVAGVFEDVTDSCTV